MTSSQMPSINGSNRRGNESAGIKSIRKKSKKIEPENDFADGVLMPTVKNNAYGGIALN